MSRPFIFGPTLSTVRATGNTCDFDIVPMRTLPADFDAMMSAVDIAPRKVSSDMAWMRHEGSVNDGEDLRTEWDGAS